MKPKEFLVIFLGGVATTLGAVGGYTIASKFTDPYEKAKIRSKIRKIKHKFSRKKES